MSHDLSRQPNNGSEAVINTDGGVQQRPWYRQFWPWFLILLPATSVVGGISLLIIAIKNADDVVADSWYKDGRAINRSMEEENLARLLGIDIVAEQTDAGLQLQLGSATPFPHPPTLSLALRHPTLADQDRVFRVNLADNGLYTGAGDLPDGRWVITLAPESGKWQLYSMDVIIRDGRFSLSAGG